MGCDGRKASPHKGDSAGVQDGSFVGGVCAKLMWRQIRAGGEG